MYVYVFMFTLLPLEAIYYINGTGKKNTTTCNGKEMGKIICNVIF